jgi:cell shape-determining protein MreC
LAEGRISDVNLQLNSVIINLGKTQGVKEGMVFLIYQGDVEVGTAKVVLARDLISAAMVQDLRPNVVLKVGDRVTVGQ